MLKTAKKFSYTATISLYYKETTYIALFTLLLQKRSWKVKLGEFESNQK